MNKDKAMQQALKALVYTTNLAAFLLGNQKDIGPMLEANAAITAMRAALEQPTLPVQPPSVKVTDAEKAWRKHLGEANQLGWSCVSFDPKHMNKIVGELDRLRKALAQPPLPVQEPVSMRMPKVGDKVICLEDESLGEVVSLTAGGSPDITFDDGSRGTYLLHEFAELFGYVAPPLPVQEPAFEGWVKIDELREHFDTVNCGTIYKHGGEGRVLLRATPPKREWVGLTEQDMPSGEDPMFDHKYFIAGLVYANNVLREKNSLKELNK